MKTLFCMLLISCLIVTNIYADDNDVEINCSGISETGEIERPKNSESRKFKIILGFCNNNITGYDFDQVAGFGFGLGFRIGYGVDIMSRLTLESTYTITFHESDIVGNESVKLNAFDVNCKFLLLPRKRVGLYANIGWGLDLLAMEGIDAGYFSYIPNFGAGSCISLNEYIDFDMEFNVHIVRIGVGEEHKPDGSYFQFLFLLNLKL
jgi:hypothetical protein